MVALDQVATVQPVKDLPAAPEAGNITVAVVVVLEVLACQVGRLE
jgi:hypothetical protein